MEHTARKEATYRPTKKGYIRLHRNNAAIFEHVLVWQTHYGAIPDGMQIHHIDEDKTNNDIANLMLVTPLDHKRLHEGCRLENGEWYKPCKDCGEYKKCDKDNWYLARGSINGRLCKKCFIKKSLEVRKNLIEKGWKRKNYPAKPNSEQTNLFAA